jgi:hypothetical protein
VKEGHCGLGWGGHKGGGNLVGGAPGRHVCCWVSSPGVGWLGLGGTPVSFTEIQAALDITPEQVGVGRVGAWPWRLEHARVSVKKSVSIRVTFVPSREVCGLCVPPLVCCMAFPAGPVVGGPCCWQQAA